MGIRSLVPIYAPTPSGGLASSGIEAMAESGSTTPLDNEIGAAVTACDALEVVGADGIASPGRRS
jgi:hypothetical protein